MLSIVIPAWNAAAHIPRTLAALKACGIAGEIVFHRPKWFHRLLHNYTPYAIQRRIRLEGLTLMILPMLDEKLRKAA